MGDVSIEIDLGLLQKGDADEFKVLYDRLFHHVWLYAWKITKDKNEGEDIATHSFAKFWERVADFDSVSEITKFIFVTAKNSSLDFLKSIRAKKNYQNHLAYIPDIDEPFQTE